MKERVYSYRPFVEARWREWGIGVSLAAEHVEGRLIPNVWIQIGPFVTGIGVNFG